MAGFHRLIIGASLSIAALSTSTPALAWGPEGHAIIAEIAEARLTPAAARAVDQLLSMEGHQHLDEAASWADAYRASHPETGPWHAVNIPLNEPGYDAARDCAGGTCVVAQILHFADALDSARASQADRLSALKFLVNLIGDLHQPLRCEDNRDHNGNDVAVTYFYQSSTLLALWESGIIEHEAGLHLEPNATPDLTATRKEAEAITQKFGPDELHAKQWAPEGLTDELKPEAIRWANESHVLAQAAYRAYAVPDRVGGWEKSYDDNEGPVIRLQLWKAGIRLAELLNEELGKEK